MTALKHTLIISFAGFCLSAVALLRAQEPAAPATSTIYPLRQILIGESVEAAEKLSFVPNGGFVVLPPAYSLINVKELTKVLAAGENRPIDDRLLVAVAQVVEGFFRRNDFPIATAIIPQQRVTDGVLRVAVLPGKFREIRFQGNRWFSESLLRDKLHVESGTVVRVSDLERAVNWTNDSPFRRIRVHIDPIPNSNEANLIVGVQERLPLRLSGSIDNGGNEVIGKHRFIAGASYGNMWGLDHSVAYQFVTTDKSKIYQAHGFNYRVPLASRHTLQVTASYAHASPKFYEGLIVQDGRNATADLRYSIPLKSGDNPMEAFATVSFKQSNNNLEFGGTQADSSKTDIFNLSAGISKVRRDPKGAWILGATLTGSPGGVTSLNRDEVFESTRHLAKASYLYGNFTAQRLQILAKGWELSSRGALQLSSERLLVSEQLSGGGASTVRGFDENSVLGDDGFVLNNEILSPVYRKPVPFLGKSRAPLESRFLCFMDAAKVFQKFANPTDRKMRALSSAGLGLRMSLPNNASFTADYGWQLTRLAPGRARESRGHLKLALAY